MKLLLDEMLSPAIARRLRARGHDVEAIAGHPSREALPDPDVLALARAEHRVLSSRTTCATSARCTTRPSTRRRRTLRHDLHPRHYRRTRDDTGKIITALEAILTDHPGEDYLANGKTWL